MSPRTAIEMGQLGGLGVLNLEGPLDPLRGPRRAVRGDRRARTRRPRGGCRRSTPSRSRRSSSVGASRRSRPPASPPRRSRPSASSSTPSTSLEAGLDILVIQGTVVSAEHVSKTAEPLNLKKFIRGFERAGHRRRLRVVLHRAAPDAHRRGRRARRRRPGPRLHHPRRARRRRPAGHRHRRRRGRPHPPPRRDRRLRARHRRRRDAHRRRHRQGDRGRRRRGDDRFAARRRVRGAGPRLPLGHGDVPPDLPRGARVKASPGRRSAEILVGPAPRTTARSTSSAPCAPRWPPPATRPSRSSRRPR